MESALQGCVWVKFREEEEADESVPCASGVSKAILVFSENGRCWR
jgi:hypothetical protein